MLPSFIAFGITESEGRTHHDTYSLLPFIAFGRPQTGVSTNELLVSSDLVLTTRTSFSPLGLVRRAMSIGQMCANSPVTSVQKTYGCQQHSWTSAKQCASRGLSVPLKPIGSIMMGPNREA